MWWIIIVVVVLVLGIIVMSIYNNLVQLRNSVRNAFSQIDVQLKRRFDLIPNLVETVKGYAKHEKDIFDQFAKARTNYQIAKDSNDIGKLAQADADLTKALNVMINAVKEQYPELKADKHYGDLMASLKDIEAKIAFARQFYNDSALSYNNKREVFPNVIIANAFGFKPFDYYKVEESAKEAPKVQF